MAFFVPQITIFVAKMDNFEPYLTNNHKLKNSQIEYDKLFRLIIVQLAPS